MDHTPPEAPTGPPPPAPPSTQGTSLPPDDRAVHFHLPPADRGRQRRLRHVTTTNPEHHLLFDTGGGSTPTIVSHAWWTYNFTGTQTGVSGYQDKSAPKLCPVASGMTKAYIDGRRDPCFLIVHQATVVDDPREHESLLPDIPLARHHVTIRGITPKRTEPHHPHQNPAEKEIGVLAGIMRRAQRQYNAPPNLHNWCQKYSVQLNNVLARRSLGWRNPTEVRHGHSGDVSAFRFGYYEPIEYLVPGRKPPLANVLPARYLCQAEHAGDAMTYYIITEPSDGSRPQILIRSVIRSRKDKPTSTEPTDDVVLHIRDWNVMAAQHRQTQDPFRPVEEVDIFGEESEQIPLSSTDPTTSDQPTGPEPEEEPGPLLSQPNDSDDDDSSVSTDSSSSSIATEDIDGPTALDAVHDEEEAPVYSSDLQLNRIVTHRFEDVRLIMTASFDSRLQSDLRLDAPYLSFRRDHPVDTARYLQKNLPNTRGMSHFLSWSQKTLRTHRRVMRRLRRLYDTDGFHTSSYIHHVRRTRRRLPYRRSRDPCNAAAAEAIQNLRNRSI